MVTQLGKVKLGFEPKSPWLQRAYISVLRKVLKIDIKWSLYDLRAGQCVQSLRLVLVSLAGDAGQGLETSRSSVQSLQPVMDPCGHLLAGPVAEKHPFGGSSAKPPEQILRNGKLFCVFCACFLIPWVRTELLLGEVQCRFSLANVLGKAEKWTGL